MALSRLTLRQLQVFAAVARRGSTIAGGDDIGLSQSAVSSALKELERTLRTALFDRVGNRLQLNEGGRAVLPQVLVLLDRANALENMAGLLRSQALALRIGASTTVGNYLLPQLVQRFYAASDVHAEPVRQSRLVVGNTARICELVAELDLDIGLIEGPCHVPALDVRSWLMDELVLVAATDSEEGRRWGVRRRSVMPIEAMRAAVWLLREPGSGTREETDRALLPHLGAYRRSVEIGSAEAIKHAASLGLGVACLSSWLVADAVDAGRLRILHTRIPRTLRSCSLVLHVSRRITPALQRFIDTATEFARLRKSSAPRSASG